VAWPTTVATVMDQGTSETTTADGIPRVKHAFIGVGEHPSPDRGPTVTTTFGPDPNLGIEIPANGSGAGGGGYLVA
jgi:hypothetical protein